MLSDLGDLVQRTGAEVRVEGPLPPIHGDPERIGQLLTNLVGNGLKYNRTERPLVVIGTHDASCGAATGEAPVPGPMVTLFVRDNGVGIAPQYHDQVFRMFRRLHRQEDVAGTGAGLTICKKIVEAHGGRIWIESQAGQGATFFVTLPRSQGMTRTAVIAQESAPTHLDGAGRPDAQRQPARIERQLT